MADKFTWFPKLTATAEKVPEELRPVLVWALIQYGTYGTEPDLAWPLDAIFESLRDDVDNSKTARNGNKGGRPPKAKKAENEVSAPGKKPGLKTPETGVSENENGGFETSEPKPIHTNTNHTNTNQGITPKPPRADGFAEEFAGCEQDPDGTAFAEFAKGCIDAFNAETGSDYRLGGGKVMLGLRRIYDNGRTLEDVRRVIAGKQAQWGRDPSFSAFLRPKTLFGENFEEYLAEQPPGKAASLGACPACGAELVPIGDVVDNPRDPSRLWCRRCRKAMDRKAAGE